MACLLLDTSAAVQEKNSLTPREILGVFHRDGNCYVRVKSLHVYSASTPSRTVNEYRAGEFEVGQFKRAFSNEEHRSILEEIDQRVAELEEDEAQRKATATGWRERLLDWLHSLSACLTADEGHTSSCAGAAPQSNDAENYNDRNDTGESIRQTAPADGPDMQRPSASASTVSTSVISTKKPPMGYSIAQTNTQDSQTSLQSSQSRSTHDHELSSTIRMTTIIDAKDTVLWIGALEAVPNIGVRARRILVRRDRLCCLVEGDISFDKLCSGRESEIEAVVGSLNYVVAWHLHQGKVGCQYPVHTGPPMKQLLAARYHWQMLSTRD